MAVSIVLGQNGSYAALFTLNSNVAIPLSGVITITPSALGSLTATVSSATGINIGAYVYSTKYPAGTVVDGISGTTLTLSQASIATGADAAARVGNSMNMIANQSITLTNGSRAISGATTTSWVSGCYIAGKGIPDGTQVINTAGTWTLTNAFTGTTGSVQVSVQAKNSNNGETGWLEGGTIYGPGNGVNNARIISCIPNKQITMSSAWTGATTVATNAYVNTNYRNMSLTMQLSASGDSATPQTFIDNGYGVLLAPKTIWLPGLIYLNIAAGAIYDDTEWTYILNYGGCLRLNEMYGSGTWLSGYVLQGTNYVKAKGHTVIYSNFDGSSGAGGRNIINTGSQPPGYPTTKPTLKWNDTSWTVQVNTQNGSAFCVTSYGAWDAGKVTFDFYSDTSGANASFGGSFGSIEELAILKVNGGLSTGIDSTQIVSIGKLTYFGLPTGGGGSNPDIKFGFPSNVAVSGFAPIFYKTDGTEFVGTYSTGNQIVDDPTFPSYFSALTQTRNYVSGTRTYRRTVTFNLYDSSATALTGTTLRVVSGSNELLNAVQAGSQYTGKLNYGYLVWTHSNSYQAPSTTVDTRSHTYLVRKYGYVEQSSTYNIEYNAFTTPIYMLVEDALSGISEATAAAITTAGINWSTKTITPTANLTYDQINARIAYELAQTANMSQANPRTIVGSNLTLASGWTLVVNNGITISEGTNITYMYVPTVTLNGTGSITGLYASSAGASTTWRFEGVQVGSSIVVYDASGVTKYFQGSVTSAGDYNYYIPPGTTGTYYWAIEKYGKQRESGSFAANTGGLLFYTPLYVEDVGITQTTQATVAAYTTLETNSKLYDYIAYFRLSEQGIKLGQIATRSGTSIEFGSYSGIVKSTHTSVLSISGSTITIKANGLAGDTKFSTIIATPPATWTAFSTEVITTEIEDGNGDSSITIEASGISTFEIWKITDATSPDDYATGTLVATVGIGKWRFLHADGYKFVVRDTTTNYRVVVEAEKGTYMAELFFGAAVQLAQAAEVTEINTKVDIMQIDLEAIKGTGFVKDKHSLVPIKKKAALAAALSA